MSSFLLGLGANLDDPVSRLEEAVRAIADFAVIDAVSSIYRTEPVGFADQPDFYNIVCRGNSPLSPPDLLARVMDVERRMGRSRTLRNGPRVIDIDILAVADVVLEAPGLMLPHPRMSEREFVLVPLSEIAPDWRNPVTGLTADDALARLGTHRRVERVGSVFRANDEP